MSVPDYETLLLPVLRLVADQKDHKNDELEQAINVQFGLTEGEKQQLLPSGRKRIIYDRIGWARVYLEKAGLIVFPKRGVTHITPRGLAALAKNPTRIDNEFLCDYEEFRQFRRKQPTVPRPEANGKIAQASLIPLVPVQHLTPEERLQYAYKELIDLLAQDLLTKVKSCSPARFERLVVDLLLRMGYGGAVEDAGQVVGKTGDEGIDGTIKEDPLGLDFIYIQAKQWQGKVGSPELHKFVGALHGQGARKGVFITSSDFTPEARAFASRVDTKVVLIDGKQMADLMIRYRVGVATAETYEIKKVQSDYFEEE